MHIKNKVTLTLLLKPLKSPYHKPKNTQAYNNIGNIYQDEGNLNKAIEAYNKAISIQPEYVDPYYNKGICLHGRISWTNL